MPKDILLQATAILVLSTAMNALAIAMKIFATLDWTEMLKGLVGVGGGLAIIGLAMRTMPKSMIVQAAALLVVSEALVILSGALKIMATMGWEDIGKGMTILAGAFTIFAIGLNAIGAAGILGAVALLGTAAALTVLTPVLITLGSLEWETILKSLVALAGVFAVLGVSALLLAPLAPTLITLAAALLLIGGGLALAGAGALAFATAFGIVVATGTAGAQVMAELLGTIIKSIPPALAAFGKGIVQFAVAIGQGAPKIAKAFGQIINNLLNTAIKSLPKIREAFLKFMNTAITVIVNLTPRIVDAGIRMMIALLGAVSDHIGEIVDKATDLCIKFMGALGKNAPKIADAGADLVIDLIHAIADTIRNRSGEVGAAAADLGIALVQGIVRAMLGAAGEITNTMLGMAKNALQSAKDFFGIGGPSMTMYNEVGVHIPDGMLKGVEKRAPAFNEGMRKLGSDALETLRTTMADASNAMDLSPDFNPTVTPILDLTKLTQDANQMSSILGTSPISPVTSYEAARGIAVAQAAAKEALDAVGSDIPPSVVNNYTQNLHSPEPLSSSVIYRNSKSLFALKKGELNNSEV